MKYVYLFLLCTLFSAPIFAKKFNPNNTTIEEKLASEKDTVLYKIKILDNGNKVEIYNKDTNLKEYVIDNNGFKTFIIAICTFLLVLFGVFMIWAIINYLE